MGDHVQQKPGDGTTSSHRSTPAATPPSSASSPLKKGTQQVELELRLLEAFAIYRPSLLAGMHRHFILFGLMHHLERRLNQRFSPDEVLQLLDRFFNLDLLEPDDEELELVNHKEDFSLPQSMLEEIKRKKISS
jgi:MRG-binding protein